MLKVRFTIAIVLALLIYSRAAADTTRINFDLTDHPLAFVGSVAADLYADQGVTFPSMPIISRIALWPSQVLQQGEYSRADPLPRTAPCRPLEIRIEPALRARRVELKVLTRHLRFYSVEAFAGRVSVDTEAFWPRGGFRGLELERTIVLEALDGEPDITSVVATPGDCYFDLMVIDDLVIEGDGPSRDPDRVYVTAYEINQAVMSRLTTRPRPDVASIPDTRLAALPGSRLPFVRGRSTVARFFLGALRRAVASYEPRLEVTIINDDGSSRTVELSENTVPFTGPPPGALRVGVVDPLLADDALTRLLVEQRNSIDRTADFVISGAALETARLIDLKLFDPSRRRLAWVSATLEGPLTMAFNLVRVQGTGTGAGIRGPLPTEPTRTRFQQYFNAIFPVSDRPTLTDLGVFTWDGPGTADNNCDTLLRNLTDAFASPPSLPSANYQGIIFLVSDPPPDCSGDGWYNTPGAFTNVESDTAAHEVSHNIGINHASNLHGKDPRGDWEAWPYLHGSIGTPNQADRNQRFGVYGAIMRQGGEPRGGPFGSWQLGIVPPCSTRDPARLFPLCTAIDDSITHDYMSYGPRSVLPVHGSVKWISDINYHRVYRFLQDCIRLDPPNRFFSGGTDMAPGIGCMPVDSESTAGLAPAGKMPSVDALIVSGMVVNGVSASLAVLRRPVFADVLSRSSGKYELALFGRDQKELRRIRFNPVPASEQKTEEALFQVVVPFDPELASLTIERQGKLLLKREATASPTLSAGPITAGGGGGWIIGQKATVTWDAKDQDSKDLRALLLYTADGLDWYPLALVDAHLGRLVVDTSALPPSNQARLYLSVSDGVNTVTRQTDPFVTRALKR